MRRTLKIILILFLIIAVILSIAWLLARRKAVRSGTIAPTFKTFITLGGKNASNLPTQTDTEFSSDFTDQEESPDTPDTSSIGVPVGSVAVSRFTTAPLSPTDDRAAGGSGTSGGSSGNGGGTGGSGTGGNGGTGGGGTGGGGTGGGGSPRPPACSDEDLNISFTADEIARLNALQNRFYDIAGTLHTDGDIAIELANHDNFKAKAEQALELYGYCASKAPLITAAPFVTRVPTPFWRDPSKDTNGYMPAPGILRAMSLSVYLGGNPIDPRVEDRGRTIIQKIFAVDLW